jgi:hypothetical protein
MKQRFNILSIAALVFAGALTTGCADQLNDPQQPQEGSGTVTLTATVGFDASTKALTAGGVKTFAAGETIAVFYTNESSNLVKATYIFTTADLIDGGRRAKMTVDVTDPKAGGAVKYIYPASMANDDGTVNYAALATQDGTLTSLANNFDLAVYDGSLTGDAALPSSATLLNQLAILELTVKNASGTPVNGSVTKLSVFDGTNVYKIIDRSAVDEPIYVALRPITSDKTIHFCATDGTTNYRRSVTSKTLERNNIYPVNLSTTETTGTALEFLTGDYTAQDGDVLSGILQGEYKISTASTGKDAPAITVTLAGVDINYSFPNQSYSHGINCRRNINLVLAAGSVNYVKGCAEGVFAGILIRSERTLTISGSGSLTAIGNGSAGICGYDGGNIMITGGTITAEGGEEAAGIGTGYAHNYNNQCGNITITSNVTRVTAEGSSDTYGIGIGSGGMQLCGTITIGGTVYWDGSSYQNDGATYLSTILLEYEPAP